MNQVADIEICHNDEMDELTGDLEKGFQYPDLEDEYMHNMVKEKAHQT